MIFTGLFIEIEIISDKNDSVSKNSNPGFSCEI